MKDEAGFSMPELMIVIVIVGILSGLAIPNFLQRWEDERLNSAAKLTTSWLEDLRRKAIQNSTVCRAVIDSAAATFTGTCDHQPTQSSVLDLQQEITNTTGLSFALQNGSPSTWIFTPREQPQPMVTCASTCSAADMHVACVCWNPLAPCVRASFAQDYAFTPPATETNPS